MDPQDKMDFPRICRELRLESGKKQREVAAALGLASAKTYGNVESNNHKTVSIDKVRKLARYHQLGPRQEAELVAAWEALPASPYNQRMAPGWDKKKAFRSKAQGYDRRGYRLAGILALLIVTHENPGALCICTFGDTESACELCDALKELGLGGWTTSNEVMRKLAALQEKLESPNTGNTP